MISIWRCEVPQKYRKLLSQTQFGGDISISKIWRLCWIATQLRTFLAMMSHRIFGFGGAGAEKAARMKICPDTAGGVTHRQDDTELSLGNV